MAILQSMEHFDIVLTPTLGEDPPALGVLNFEANGSDLARWSERGYTFAPFVGAANLSGQPAASCPVAISTRGIPIGIQIAGHPGDDLLVLQLALEIEQASDWKDALNRLQERLV